jgi:hypothetical protein
MGSNRASSSLSPATRRRAFSSREAVEVGALPANNTVGVQGGAVDAVGLGGGPTTHQVFDAVTVQGLDEPRQVVGRALSLRH